MSEAEKQRRAEYKKNRKKWLNIQAIILSALIVLTLIFSLVFAVVNKATYIDFTENGKVDYSVLLKDNDFYDKPQAEKDKAYVTSLVNDVLADFSYELYMDAKNVDFEYSYSVNAVMEVRDGKTGAVIFDRAEALVPETKVSKSGNSLLLRQQVAVDFDRYNDLARQFVDSYGLQDAKAVLLLTLDMHVIGDCEEFGDETNNAYALTLDMPLIEKTCNISVLSDVEQGDNRILACKNVIVKNVLLGFAIGFAVLSALGGAGMVVFAYLTRNTDINYEIRVNRILKSYRSFIQKINNCFADESYRPIFVDSFNEMLEIHDTIQSPVLMYENEDKTCSSFYIPTNTNLLYVYEVKVDDYDEIYAPKEEMVILEEVAEEEMEEAMSAPDVELSEIDYVDVEEEEAEDGVEVIDVVWPEKEKKNKLYRYDPNGETVHDGDIVLVPSRDAAKQKEVIRKATVAHGNHRVDPEHIHHPLKKIIAIVKRKAEDALSHQSK